MSSAKIVNELLALHGAGRIADMESRARAHLKAQPSSPILNELLGIALSAQRRFADALPFLEKAVRRQPDEPQFRENLALCLRELRQHAGAAEHLRHALQLRPRSVEALNALGSVLRELDRTDEAETAFRQALAIDPGHPAANFNLGKLLLVPRTAAQAEPYFQRALARAPGLLANVHHARGTYYARIGQLETAEQAYRDALAVAPTHIATLAQLAALYDEAGYQDQALKTCEQTLALMGDLRQAVHNGHEIALCQLANVLTLQDRLTDALAIYRTLREFRTDPEIALPAYGAARSACDWEFARSLEADAVAMARLPKQTGAGLPSFTFLSLPSATRDDQLKVARLNAAIYTPDVLPIETTATRSPQAGRKLRIGYLSNDFYNHATAHLLAGVIEAHDRDSFEIVAYDYSPLREDDYRRRLQQGFDRFVAVNGQSNAVAAQAIADDGIDIAVDLKGWTQGARCAMLAARPAPVQMQWLGYPGTLGAPWIDYIIADPVLIRPGEEGDYSEKIIRLPHSYQPNDRARQIAAVPTRADAGLPDAGFVFCSFNQSYKLTLELFSVWLDLLARIDGSVLWLLECPRAVMDTLRRRAAAAGIAPERLVFAPKKPIAEHLARTSLADLAVDCFPYGSHTTASDALWAGVPFVALTGDTFASRVSSSLLTALGLPDLITTSRDTYFDLAARLATDPDLHAAVKSRIKTLRDSAPLFDTRRFTRNLERAFTMAWERHASGLAPDHLQVSDPGTR